jgi:nitroreductase
MHLQEVFNNRRSVRKFKPDAIPENIINEILQAANTAPCTDTCNYYFGVIRDPQVKHAIAEATVYATWVEHAPVIFVCCGLIESDMQDADDGSYVMQGLTGRYGEEIVVALKAAKDRKAVKILLLATPVYIAAQHMILTAVSHGLRGCLVDFIHIEQINQILALPDHITCQLLVPIGYPDEIAQPVKVNEAGNVFFDHWNNRESK